MQRVLSFDGIGLPADRAARSAQRPEVGILALESSRGEERALTNGELRARRVAVLGLTTDDVNADPRAVERLPRDPLVGDGAVAVCHADGRWKPDLVALLGRKRDRLDVGDHDGADGPRAHILEDAQRGERRAVRREERLVVDGGSAVPASRVVGVVLCGEARRPAGAELLPLRAIALEIVRRAD